MTMDIWGLPQELRDDIYEKVLTTNGDQSGPSQLPVRLDLVCRRVREETRRLYCNKTVRAAVLAQYWLPCPVTENPSKIRRSRFSLGLSGPARPLPTLSKKIRIKISTPKHANYSALVIELVVILNQHLEGIGTRDSRAFVVERGGDQDGVDLFKLNSTEETRVRDQELHTLFNEAGERLKCLIDHGDPERQALGEHALQQIRSREGFFWTQWSKWAHVRRSRRKRK